ncbi:MAG: hypothetical protein HUU46_07525 [Candidatus Hydrogenedentes bacterium]|nr:hypothetical protein [Candidatus Hydrogenedentota bacterium]
MGDACNMADIERFMRSKAGKKHLREIRKMLKGHTVVDVSFSNEVCCIATTIHLDDGESFVVFQPSLEVDALRDEFSDVLQEEYYRDFPERRPKEGT